MIPVDHERDTERLDELERTKCYPFWNGSEWVYIVAQDRSIKIDRRGTGKTIREAIDAASPPAPKSPCQCCGDPIGGEVSHYPTCRLFNEYRARLGR